MRKLLDKLTDRDYDRREGIERDLTVDELETLLEIVNRLDLQNSYMEQGFNNPTAKVIVGVHSSESRIGVLDGLEPDTAAALVSLFDELIPIIRQAIKRATL